MYFCPWRRCNRSQFWSSHPKPLLHSEWFFPFCHSPNNYSRFGMGSWQPEKQIICLLALSKNNHIHTIAMGFTGLFKLNFIKLCWGYSILDLKQFCSCHSCLNKWQLLQKWVIILFHKIWNTRLKLFNSNLFAYQVMKRVISLSWSFFTECLKCRLANCLIQLSCLNQEMFSQKISGS